MTGYLADTNVISELAKSSPHRAVSDWLEEQDVPRLASVTVFELAAGIERLPAGRRRRFLDEWLAVLLAGAVDVLPFDAAAALVGARLDGDARRRGKPIPDRDLLVLATAKAHDLGVATRDLGHFRGHGVPIYDPFSGTHAL